MARSTFGTPIVATVVIGQLRSDDTTALLGIDIDPFEIRG
jgi:hypothetical protein